MRGEKQDIESKRSEKPTKNGNGDNTKDNPHEKRNKKKTIQIPVMTETEEEDAEKARTEATTRKTAHAMEKVVVTLGMNVVRTQTTLIHPSIQMIAAMTEVMEATEATEATVAEETMMVVTMTTIAMTMSTKRTTKEMMMTTIKVRINGIHNKAMITVVDSLTNPSLDNHVIS